MIDLFIKKLCDKISFSEDNIKKTRDIYNKKRLSFVDTLIESGIVNEYNILETLSSIYLIPFIKKISMENNQHDFTEKISIKFLKKFCIVPLEKDKKIPAIALHDPSNMSPIDDIISILNFNKYELFITPKNEILSAINTFYNTTGSAMQLVEDMEGNGSSIIQEIEQTKDLLDDTSDAPVIRLVNHIISQSAKANASDVHIEPFQDNIIIRYRIDGILYNLLSPPRWIQPFLVSRIKVMSNMDIAEKRIPQDGRFDVRIGDQEIDIRVSTVPTSFGERLVMRLLNKSRNFLELTQFGMEEKQLAVINNLIRQNSGILLVTGPTGSGKTTTLYAALSAINSSDKNIITIEDPVEYNLKGIGQIQVNRKIGVTFAKGLRSIVRQDPDVILVGEIRDLETSKIAIQSALTGHLVFSTLHTNDSAGAVTRLVELGVEPYLITSSVKAVIAQRLIRILCDNCKKEYLLDTIEIKNLNISKKFKDKTVYKANGCLKCFDTGYIGRQAIFEIIEINDELKAAILKTSDSNKIKKIALKNGMSTLRDNCIKKLLNGTTSLKEVLRVT